MSPTMTNKNSSKGLVTINIDAIIGNKATVTIKPEFVILKPNRKETKKLLQTTQTDFQDSSPEARVSKL